MKCATVADIGITVSAILPAFISLVTGHDIFHSSVMCALQGWIAQFFLTLNALYLSIQAVER